MASGHRLHVILGIPVAVEDDHGVSSSEIDADSSSAGGEQKHKAIGIFVETVDTLLAIITGDAAIQSLAAVSAELAELVDQIDHFDHLREDQHLEASYMSDGRVK